MTRNDPIQQKYFSPLQTAEIWADVCFWLAAILSFATLLIERTDQPTLYDVTQGCFILFVIATFVVGLVIKLYLFPRAEEKRRQEFLSTAFAVPLIHERTTAYYNNACEPGEMRMSAQVLENSLFSKSISARMAVMVRIQTAVYLILWLTALLHRKTDLAMVAVAAQTLFSEQLLSKWLRIEWLRMKFERTFDDTYRLIQSGKGAAPFSTNAIAAFAYYESAKTNAGITLSNRLFNKLNPSLSAEWNEIRRILKI